LANQLNGSWFFSVGLKNDYMTHVLVQHFYYGKASLLCSLLSSLELPTIFYSSQKTRIE
jgi:hypothetical protein